MCETTYCCFFLELLSFAAAAAAAGLCVGGGSAGWGGACVHALEGRGGDRGAGVSQTRVAMLGVCSATRFRLIAVLF